MSRKSCSSVDPNNFQSRPMHRFGLIRLRGPLRAMNGVPIQVGDVVPNAEDDSGLRALPRQLMDGIWQCEEDRCGKWFGLLSVARQQTIMVTRCELSWNQLRRAI
ncbi:hypothetical protein L1887_58382 [Cichorium endivia]|nr:hypothetical protein L1887_58382 [Cichorium endivia]